MQNRRPVVFITGASSGIGAALAAHYAKRGADLILTSRRIDRLQALASELSVHGGRVLTYPCDVTKEDDLKHVANLAREALGSFDVVIANAGFGVVGNVEDLAVDDYRRQFETNVFGVLRTVYATLDDLKKTKGCLAITGSVNGYTPLPGISPYAMSKFAVRALAHCLRDELAPYGVSVTHIAPGFVESEIRLVDNEGAFKEGRKDRVPSWLQMSAQKAAVEIARAIDKRLPEAVITGHGKAVVFVTRHAPRVLDTVVRVFKIHGRSEP